MLQFLTFRVAIQVVNKIRDCVVKSCCWDAIVVLAVVHKLQAFSLVHSYENVIVEELPLVVKNDKCFSTFEIVLFGEVNKYPIPTHTMSTMPRKELICIDK